MALEHIERQGRRIRERRVELGLTQEQIAERMQAAWAEQHPSEDADRTRGQMVSDWERAANAPSPGKLELLASALDTNVADLMAGPLDERGKSESGETPDVIGTLNDDVPDAEQRLAQIEATVMAIADHLGIERPVNEDEGRAAPDRLPPDSDRPPAAPGDDEPETPAEAS